MTDSMTAAVNTYAQQLRHPCDAFDAGYVITLCDEAVALAALLRAALPDAASADAALRGHAESCDWNDCPAKVANP